MFLDSEEYELQSSLDIDSLLADLPLELMKENIKEQINDPLSNNTDYIGVIMDKCLVLKQEYQDDEDGMNTINNYLREFCQFIIDEVSAKFDFEVNIVEDDLSKIQKIAICLYKFLIIRYKKNIAKFIYEYIAKNKKRLVEQFEALAKKKDVTTLSLKKQIKNKDDVLIISNLPTIIKYIFGLQIEPIDFISYSCNEKYYEGTVIKKMILDNEITGNFIPNYFDLALDEDDVLDEVLLDAKLKIAKKLL